MACSADGVGPHRGRLDGAYAVRSVNRVPVPAIAAEGGGQRYILLADTLSFSPGGTVERSLVYRRISETESPRDTVFRHRMTFPYAVEGAHITIGSRAPCPPNANCVGFEEGEIRGAQLRVIGRIFWSGGPLLLFERTRNR